MVKSGAVLPFESGGQPGSTSWPSAFDAVRTTLRLRRCPLPAGWPDEISLGARRSGVSLMCMAPILAVTIKMAHPPSPCPLPPLRWGPRSTRSRGTSVSGQWTAGRRRITGWGLAAILALLTSLVLGVTGFRTQRPLPSRLEWFLPAAVAGYLIVWALFRFEKSPSIQTALSIAAAAALVFMFFVLPVPAPAVYGLTFGGAAAWFPHCWPVIGVRNSNRPTP